MPNSVRRIFGIMLLAGSFAASAEQFPDATVIDADYHKVVLENEYVRVLESRASPGATSHMHSHPDRVIVSMDAARLKVTLPDGSENLWDFHPQEVMWLPADAHQWEVIAGEIAAYVIEIKSAEKAE